MDSTASPGAHVFRARVADAISNVATATAAFTVSAPPGLSVTSVTPSSAMAEDSPALAVLGNGFAAGASLSLERLDVQRGSWTATGAFSHGRYYSTLTTMRGGKVLLAGGYDEVTGGGLAETDVYDPATGTWISTAPLAQARRQHAAVALADGRVLVTGGIGFSGNPLATAEIFDPSAGTWTSAGSMSVPRGGHSSVLLRDGRVLVAGGGNGPAPLATAEIYDPASNAWTAAATMSAVRFFAPMTVLRDGRVLISGDSGSTAAERTAEVYDPATNSWAPAGTMSESRYLHSSQLLPDGRVLVAGGGAPNQMRSSADVYDPATNAWTPTGPLAAPRYAHSALLIGGRALIVGGENVPNNLATSEVYDPQTNTWSAGPALGAARGWPAAALLPDGRGLVASGRGDSGVLAASEILSGPTSRIDAGGVAVSDSQHLSGTAVLSGAASGYWDVVVRSAQGASARLPASFRVIPVPIPDTLPPVASISFSSPSFVSAAGGVTMATQAAVALSAVDQSSGVPSGVSAIFYGIDVTTPSASYTSPFLLSPGTHTVAYTAIDGQGNRAAVSVAAVTVTSGPAVASVTPSSAALGVSFTVSGFNFAARNTSKSKVLLALSTASITSWSDTQIVARVPGLSTGTYSLSVVAARASTQASPGVPFDVIAPRLDAIAPSAGPAGITAFLYGANFGASDGTRTRVLFAGTTAQIFSWSDAVIKVDVPAVSTGGVVVQVERQSLDGATVRSNSLLFTMEGMILSDVSPSTGPVGRVVTLTGADFGPSDGANSRVRFGPSTGTVISWTDTSVTASVPNLSTGVYPLVLERVTASSVTSSTFLSFAVTPLVFGALDMSSGPVGSIITVAGAGYGQSDGPRTRVLVNGSTTTLVSWSDEAVSFRVPGLPDGTYAIRLERQARNGGFQRSGDGSFQVASPRLDSVSPSSAPIGQANVVISGLGFGAKDGTRTRVVIGGVSAAVASWTDAAAKVTVPASLAPGEWPLIVERDSLDGYTARSSSLTFSVLRPTISTIAPNFGGAGALITMTGYGFGASLGTGKSLVLIGGTTAQFTVWNDTTIKWKVPASLANGTYTVVAARLPVGGYVESNGVPFTVGSMALASFAASAPASLAAQPDQNFEAGMNVPADEGGRIESVALAAVAVPAGALSEDTELTVKRLRSDGLRTAAADAAKVRTVGEPIEFGPEGTRFNAPVTIELPYDPALTRDEDRVAIHYYNPLRRQWEALASVVDKTRKVVTAQTDHFSIYQPLGLSPATAAQDEFYLRGHYAYPNPARGGIVTFRFQPGLADDLELRVYDVAGRRVYSAGTFVHTNPGGEHQYEHAWNVSGIGSGIYTYFVVIKRAGQANINASGRVGVIK